MENNEHYQVHLCFYATDFRETTNLAAKANAPLTV
jgi:hypothetical protein